MTPLDAVEDCKTSCCKILFIDITAETSSDKEISAHLPASLTDANTSSQNDHVSDHRLGNVTCFSTRGLQGAVWLVWEHGLQCAMCSVFLLSHVWSELWLFFKNNFLFAKHMTVNWLHLLFLLLHKLSFERICYYNILTFIQTLILRGLASS